MVISSHIPFFLAAFAACLLLHSGTGQDVISSSTGKDFYIGFMRGVGGGGHVILRLLIGTTASNATYRVTGANDQLLASGVVVQGSHASIDIPSDMFEVVGSGFSDRAKGIHVHSNDEPIFVIAENIFRFVNYGTFLAYPCLTIESESSYEYYVISTNDPSDFFLSQVLLVGCENDTTISVEPTQTVTIPLDTQSVSADESIAPGSTSHEFTLHQMQTLLLSSFDDLTGTKIVSNKPLTVISGHECAGVLGVDSGCEPFAVQVPPAIAWGNRFLLAPFAGRDGPQLFRVISAEPTDLTYTCGSSTEFANNITEFLFNSSEYCYLHSEKPILVVELSFGVHIDNMGDPAIAPISPIDQYVSKTTFFTLPTNDFPNNFISVTVLAEHFNASAILLDGVPIACTWEDIFLPSGIRVGYGCSHSVQSGVTTPQQHTLSHMDGGLVSALVYGFSSLPGPDQGYAYLAGQNITVNASSTVEEDDSISFVDLTGFPGVKELDNSSPDSTSEPIKIPYGLLFGDRIVTTAYVSENGVVSFDEPWKFSFPNRFPTDFFPTQQSFAIAPFWSDNDIRKEGAVRYATYSVGDANNPLGESLLQLLNQRIQSFQDEDEEDPFEGQWLLTAHWDGVHPSPHGEDDHRGIPENLLDQTNNYQIFIVSNVTSTFVLFAYDIQWSAVGAGDAAVMGFNAEGNYFFNHPFSGISEIGCALNGFSNCDVDSVSVRKKRNTVGATNCLQLPTNKITKEQIENCQRRIDDDFFRIRDASVIKRLEEMLEPCPCLKRNAEEDCGRFKQQSKHPGCFISVKTTFTRLGFPSLARVALTQQCCYDDKGGLITDPKNGDPGVMMIEPFDDNGQFRSACCPIDNSSDINCTEFFNRRPINKCKDPDYTNPVVGIGWGDPHYETFDKHKYDFQGIGEFSILDVLQEVGDSPIFSLQGRLDRTSFWTSPVTTHLGLAFGNQQQAFYIGESPGFKVYQTRNENEDTDTDITAMLSSTPLEFGDQFGDQASLRRTGNILTMCHYKSGVRVVVTVYPRHNNEYYMDFKVFVPTSYMGMTRGLLGNFDGNNFNEFYRRDGTQIPGHPPSYTIYREYTREWNIANDPSNFLHPVTQNGRRKRQTDDFQPLFFEDLNITEAQRAVCSNNSECILDLIASGNETLALATLEFETETMTLQEELENFPPEIVAEATFRVNLGPTGTTFNLSVTDPNGDDFTLTVEGGLASADVSEVMNVSKGEFLYRIALFDLPQLENNPLVFRATDTKGATSTFIPTLEVCACGNGGQCTLDRTGGIDAIVIMNCICPEAYSGRFCEEDRDGCSEIQCFEGTDCVDIPAPGVGAQCTGCPIGFTGDSQKCYDINECLSNNTLCDQVCVNTEGGYFCDCLDGFTLSGSTNKCEDVDECSGVNDCQQDCQNTLGSYNCSCRAGFTLDADLRSCTADIQCSLTCENGVCATVDGIDQCFCDTGFTLMNNSCVDVDECLEGPCHQLCNNTIGSFECLCQTGYQLQENGRTCQDINECLNAAFGGFDICESDPNSECVNTEGSFMCSCVSGYSLLGGSCERTVCSSLGSTANAYISYSTSPNDVGSYVTGTIATYTCNDHHQLNGATTRLCRTDREWSGAAPTCDVVMCQALAPPTNGDITFSTDTTAPFDALTTAVYSCDARYTLSDGDQVRTCVSNEEGTEGMWTGTMPMCKEIQCPPLPRPAMVNPIAYTKSASPEYPIGTHAIYICSAGSIFRGGNFIRLCTENGSWGGREAICEGITIDDIEGCADIPDPNNGDIEFTVDKIAPFAEDTIAVYHCNHGYSLVGDNYERVCHSDGVEFSWNGTAPVCEGITCAAIVAPGNSSVLYDQLPGPSNNYRFGTVATFSCAEGYGLDGSMTAICEEDAVNVQGAFSPQKPTCEPTSCPVLGTVSNGQVTYSTDPDELGRLPFGAVASYSCARIHALQGEATRVCTGDVRSSEGYFSGTEPTCEEITCSDLAEPENGQITFSSNSVSPYDIGVVARYSCEEGFSLENGDVVRTCLYDEMTETGVWSGSAPTCVGTCKPLSANSNGLISYSVLPDVNNEYLAGTVANYTCDEGYEIFGVSTRTCRSNMTWSGSEPRCLTVCPSLDIIEDGSILFSSSPNANGNYPRATLAMYSCDLNFRLTGMANRMCEMDKQWSGMAPTCERIMCPDLSDPPNGNIIYVNDTTAPFELGTQAMYTCDEGFALVGNDVARVCVTNEISEGVWSGQAPACQAVTCSLLPLPMNAYNISYSTLPNPDLEYLTEARHRCDDGFMLIAGDEVRVCEMNGDNTTGTWSGEEPTCSAIIARCSDIPNPAKGRVEFSPDKLAPFDLGTTAKYVCDLGYGVIEGTDVRTCVKDGFSEIGLWSGAAPICVAVIECPLLQAPNNGSIRYSEDIDKGIGFGVTASYRCNVQGLGLSGGVIMRTCGPGGDNAGQWDGEAPSCELIRCPDIADPINGQIVFVEDRTAPFDYGTNATYSCNFGYTLSGTNTVRVCGGDGRSAVGEWSGESLGCLPDASLSSGSGDDDF